MARKITSYHKRIVAFLRDGKFHPLREIYRAVARFISPQVADIEYRRRHPDWVGDPLKVRLLGGRKRLIFLSLNTMHHHRKLVEVRERSGRDWNREYRLTRETLKKLAAREKRLAKV